MGAQEHGPVDWKHTEVFDMSNEHYLLTDRPEAVPGLEDHSDAIWEEFQLLASVPTASPRPQLPRNHAVAREWRLSEVLEIATLRGRVCPKPQPWFDLHALLAGHATPGELPPRPPADAQSWKKTSSRAKATCFGDHIRWAADRPRALHGMAEFLLALREDEWHHGGGDHASTAASCNGAQDTEGERRS